MSLNRYQRGYLMEVPVILALTGVVLALLLPRLGPTGVKILLVVAALIVLRGLFYMIVTPGWQPGNPKRIAYPYNLMLFGVVAVAILLLLGSMLLLGG
jgi:hypothetical protein